MLKKSLLIIISIALSIVVVMRYLFIGNTNFKQEFMNEALNQAEIARSAGETPVGAVIAYQNKIIAKGYNSVKKSKNISEHAEIMAINELYRKFHSIRKIKELDLEIYTSYEPCGMCSSALSEVGINRIYIAEPKTIYSKVKKLFSSIDLLFFKTHLVERSRRSNKVEIYIQNKKLSQSPN